MISFTILSIFKPLELKALLSNFYDLIPHSYLMEKNSIPWKTVEGTWNSSLLKKDKMFWEDGIMKLSEKRQKVVEQNGEYVVS